MATTARIFGRIALPRVSPEQVTLSKDSRLSGVGRIPVDFFRPLFTHEARWPAAGPFQVTWSVRPQVVKIEINSVGEWLEANALGEEHAHGVRNLVTDPNLLSPIN